MIGGIIILDKIIVNGVEYKVKTLPFMKTDDVLGEIDVNSCEITIKEGDKQAMVVTLLHEIIHGILYQTGYNSHNESEIDALAYGLYSVLKNNSELVKLITKK